jgi:Tol biopolymer transport system component
MVRLIITTALLAACVAQADMLAFIAGPTPQQQTLCLMDLETRTANKIGAGRYDGMPAWSHDGRKLAYHTATEGDGSQILVLSIAPDGTVMDTQRIPHQHPYNFRPVWSPDSRYLAYEAYDQTPAERVVCVYDRDEDEEQVWAGGGKGFLRPEWLPSPRMFLALDPDSSLNVEGIDMDLLRREARLTEDDILEDRMPLALMAVGAQPAAGKLRTELFLLTRSQTLPLLPFVPDTDNSARYCEWAVTPNPKGDRVAFESNDGGDREIFVLTRRGLIDATNHRADDWNPVWAPGGKWLAFESFRGGRRGVYTLLTDTARAYPVDAAPSYDAWNPAWSPDGDRLAYVRDDTGQPEIYVIDAAQEARSPNRLTENILDGGSVMPVWRPEVKE